MGLGVAAAQSPKWQYGMRALLAVSEARWTSAAPSAVRTRPHWGPSYGVFARYRLSNRVALESGVTLVSKDYHLRFDANPQYGVSSLFSPNLEIPLLVVLPFRLNEKYNWYVSAGVAGTFNKRSLRENDLLMKVDPADGEWLEQTRFDGQRFSVSGQARVGFERIKEQDAVWSVGLVYNYQLSQPVVRSNVTYRVDGVQNQAQLAYHGSYVGLEICRFFRF